jgi:GR25 family glycosyltransferase involved in LPS biosynthesis
VVDLNKQDLPDLETQAIAALGLIEYIYDVPRLLSRIAGTCNVVVLSYNSTDFFPDLEERLGNAWVNQYSVEDLEKLFSNAGLLIEEKIQFNATQILWKLLSQKSTTKNNNPAGASKIVNSLSEQLMHQTTGDNQLTWNTYLLSLKASTDRRSHFATQAKKAGITSYSIIDATEAQSDRVTRLFDQGKVMRYPPCFRCGLNTCECANNVLIRQQIGNWCTFIDAMTAISSKKDGFLSLICEDDVFFEDSWGDTVHALISAASFRSHNIRLDLPLLIRLEHRGERSYHEPMFTNDIVMSNACFMVNSYFAESFLKHITVIDRTSDMYIHDQLLQLDPTIQHLSISPAPSHQLSDNPSAIFRSEIHPKGIDPFDMVRLSKHVKRVTQSEWDVSQISNLWHSVCNDGKNVGDLVGKYLFEKLAKRPINFIHPFDTTESVFLTVGSIIQEKHVTRGNTIIWGSGIMFENIPAFSAVVHAVRGKKTKAILDNLGTPCPSVFGDPALLLPKFFDPIIEKNFDIGIVRHWSHSDLDTFVLAKRFRGQGFSVQLIDASLAVEDFVRKLKQCSYVLSSSLHGVIISHAYGIKCLPFFIEDELGNEPQQFQANGEGRTGRTPKGVQFFKFEDYYSSFDVEMTLKYFVNDLLDHSIVDRIEGYVQPSCIDDLSDELLRSCPFLPYWNKNIFDSVSARRPSQNAGAR